jgi:hypothetical protein
MVTLQSYKQHYLMKKILSHSQFKSTGSWIRQYEPGFFTNEQIMFRLRYVIHKLDIGSNVR